MGEAAREFRSTDRLTQWARYLLYAQAAGALMMIVAHYLEYHALAQMQAHAGPTAALSAAVHASIVHRLRAYGLYILLYIATLIVLMRWVYLANANARSLGAQGMRFSPAWSVGWFFVPIANLWKPYQVMKEIWKASHDPADWPGAPAGPIVVPWWSFKIVAFLVTLLALPFLFHVPHIVRLLRLDLLDQGMYALVIGYFIMTAALIRAVHRAQRQTYARQEGAA